MTSLTTKYIDWIRPLDVLINRAHSIAMAFLNRGPLAKVITPLAAAAAASLRLAHDLTHEVYKHGAPLIAWLSRSDAVRWASTHAAALYNDLVHCVQPVQRASSQVVSVVLGPAARQAHEAARSIAGRWESLSAPLRRGGMGGMGAVAALVKRKATLGEENLRRIFHHNLMLLVQAGG